MVRLTNKKFLRGLERCNKWEEFNQSELDVWSCKIRNFKQRDLIILMTIWVESRGIPKIAWLEENLKGFTGHLWDGYHNHIKKMMEEIYLTSLFVYSQIRWIK